MSSPATTAPASPILGPSVSPRTIDSFLRAVPSVDEVGVAERAGALSTRSVKRESKLAALDLAIRMCDLTTLEGRDTPGKVVQLASKAVRPDPTDPSIPPVAALCVYPNMVPHAVEGSRRKRQRRGRGVGGHLLPVRPGPAGGQDRGDRLGGSRRRRPRSTW